MSDKGEKRVKKDDLHRTVRYNKLLNSQKTRRLYSYEISQ